MGTRARAGRAALTLITSIALITGLAGESPAATGTLAYTDAGRAALAFGTALVLATGLSTSAQAMTGTFTYRDNNENVDSFQDKSNGVCFFFLFPASETFNNTNTKATVYESTTCGSGCTVVVAARGSTDVGGDTLNSVKFG